nr:hypothetical protein [Candidatus Njordarchaeota archaeon]
MSFVKTTKEIRKNFTRETLGFIGAEILSVSWETKPEIMQSN